MQSTPQQPEQPPATPSLTQFEVSPHILKSLVTHQSTTLDRAISEAVMNSVDAKARAIHLTVTPESVTIQDDGQGLQTVQDIERYFKVFGFDHDSEEERGKRQYGKFGLGRAQLFAFGITTWRTATFELTVDLQTHGLAYTFRQGLPHQTGVTITVQLYERPLTHYSKAFDSQLKDLTNDLNRHFRYAPTEVVLNGTQINRDPAQEEWTHEDDLAYYQVAPNLWNVAVYNQGIYVTHHSSPVGGVIVSKVALPVNVTRNESHGGVWDDMLATFTRLRTQERLRKKRLTEEDRAQLIADFQQGDVSWADIRSVPLFEDVCGGTYTFQAFARRARTVRKVTVAPGEGDLLSDRLQQHGLVLVLTPRVLRRFNVRNHKGLVEKLTTLLGGRDEDSTWEHWGPGSCLSHLGGSTFYATPQQAAPDFHVEHELLQDKQLTAEELVCVTALRKAQYRIRQTLDGKWGRGAGRKLWLGSSTTAEGWTDGQTYIAVSRDMTRFAREGFPGFLRLCTLLLHEYVHDSDSLATGVHGLDFYRAFHDAAMKPGIAEAAVIALLEYVRVADRQGVKVAPRTRKAADAAYTRTGGVDALSREQATPP